MRGIWRISLVGVVGALLLSGCAGGSSSTGSRSFIAGNGTVTFISTKDRVTAPAIEGKTLDATPYRLEKGRVGVLNVWASWCAPCRAEAPSLVALSETFPEVSFIGVLTRDNLSTARAFVKRFSIPYPTLVDDSILLGFRNSLIANAIPTTLVIDKNGKVAARISGEITIASLTDLIERVSKE
ncbi:MAG: TlpA disulfide reductase family protein [Candidatus Nanopelagicaceae bacterium]|nr:TlpA disulfide reductase family protein [Candidatus Nanopelagicaceae bacterium]